MVLKPVSTAWNGGEVSVGGQHNILESLLFVVVKFAPDDMGLTNPSFITMLKVPPPVFFPTISDDPPSKADPCASQPVFPTASKLDPPSTKISVSPSFACCVVTKQRVCKDPDVKQKSTNESLSRPFDW